MDAALTWILRYGHVLAAALWVGGYVLLALVLLPAMRTQPGDALLRVALRLVRVLTYAGVATLLLGLLLVARTRGFGNLLHGEWGGIVVGALVIAVALLGIGDGALRPALRAGPAAMGRASRWAMIGAILSVIAIGIMTRAIYASS